MKAHLDAKATQLVAVINRRIIAHLKKQPQAFKAYVLPDTYDPSDGTIAVRVSHTAYITAQQDGIDLPIDPIRVPMMVASFGHQYGPRGYEEVTLVPRAGRYAAIFEHTDASSPKAPTGENWLVHYTATAVADLYIRLTNSLGIRILAGPEFNVATANGHAVLDMNDSTGLTQVGATGLSTTADAVATQRFVMQYVTNVFNSHTHSAVQSGSGVSGPPVTPMPTFVGSSSVLAKP